jgi:hypothetical protein
MPVALALAVLALAGGCGSRTRTANLTEAEVVVTINGQALPNALVTLTPTQGYGPDAIATGRGCPPRGCYISPTLRLPRRCLY